MIDNRLEEELVLLGTWLRGEHLEDIKKLDYNMFRYSRVVKLLDEGFDAVQVSQKAGIKLSELMHMTTYSMPLFYRQTLRSWSNRKLERELKEFNINEDGINKLKELIANQNLVSIQVDADKDITTKYVDYLHERERSEGVLWSRLPSLNRMTNGIKRKQLTAIAGRPASGKSALALQVLLGMVESGQKVLYFPLEMSDNEMIERILIHKRIITSDEASSGKVSGKHLDQAVTYLRNLEGSGNLKFYEGVRNIESMEEAIRKEKPFAIVVDQLTQMRSSEEKFKGIREQFSYMTSNLKSIAMRNNVAVILLCQINRGAEEQKPTLANLKESGSIEEDSDNVILIHRLSQDNINNPEALDWNSTRPMLLILAKQRSGDIGEAKVLFKPSEMLFYEEVRPQ